MSERPGYYSPPPGVIPGAPGYRPASRPEPQPAYAPPVEQGDHAAPARQPASAATPGPTLLGARLPAGVSATLAAVYAALAVVGIMVLAIGVVMYNSAAQKDRVQRIAAADKAVTQVVHLETTVGDKLTAAFEPEKGPLSPTKSYNADSVRQAIKDVQPGLDSAARTVGNDQSTLRTALTAINDRGPISLTSGDQLDRKAGQIEAVSRAVDVRAEEITTARQQLTVLNDLTTAQENFAGLAAALVKKDMVTATARYGPSNNAIKQAVADAQQATTPDAVRTYVNEVSGFIDATQSVINSLQAQDFGEYTASLRVFTTQLENLASYDPKTMRQQYDALTKSYDDRYNSYLHDAGLTTGAKAL